MGILKTNSIQHPSNANNSIAFHSGGEVSFPKKPVLLTNMSNVLGGVGSLSSSAANGVANVGILQAAAQIDQGDTGWTTSGTNAYTFVCPVDGIYAVNAHASYGNITPGRVIWNMMYQMGGGTAGSLATYVEVMDHTSIDYANISYFNLWEFTAGTRLGMGRNSASGTQTAINLQWGIHLVA